MNTQRRAPWILIGPFLLLFLLTFVAPIAYAVVQSFTRVDRAGLFGEQGTSTVFAGLSNYVQAFAGTEFLASIGRMLLFGVVQVTMMILAATVLALLLESTSARWPSSSGRRTSCPTACPG